MKQHVYWHRPFLQTVLLLLALSLLLGGCKPDSPSGDQDSADLTSGEGEAQTGEEPGGWLNIVKDDVAAGIVYALEAEGTVIERANSLAQSIQKMTDVRPSVGDDWLRAGEEHDAAAVEILIGRTNYPESAEIYATLGYGEGAVAVVGNKVVVAGTDDSSLASAVTRLLAALSQHRQENTLCLPTDLSVRVVANDLLAALPVLPDVEPDVIDAGDNCWELVFSQAGDADFQTYAGLLAADGYELYTESSIEDNRFQTRTDGTNAVTVTYAPGLQKLFVLIEPLSMTALPGKEADNVYTPGVTTTMLTQIGLYHPSGATTLSDFNGMCYVMRLEDGSFLIIDGGHGDAGDAERIYETMRRQAPDPERLVVAAWIFTHAHGDHVGVFPSFTSQYADRVTVERFIFNFPSEAQAAAGGGDKRAQVAAALRSEHYKDSMRIKAHAGQVFYIRNATVTMLCGLELLEPYRLEYYNNCSLVFTVEADDRQFLFLGDCGELEDRTLRRLYSAETLGADFLQIAHHGVNGCGTELYTLASPEYAFWPAGSFLFDGLDLTKLPINEYFFDPGKIAPENVFLAGGGIVTAELAGDEVIISVYETDTAYLNPAG